MIHSYPWYVADWRQSETRIRLALPERAIYRELLDYCWAEGSLPTDEKTLAVICACDIREFRKSWKAVKQLFIEQDGRLTHHRVVAGRDKLQSWNEARREAGKKGGLGKAIATAKAKAPAKLGGYPSTSTSVPNPPTPLQAKPEPFDCELAFEELWNAYPEGGRANFVASQRYYTGIVAVLPEDRQAEMHRKIMESILPGGKWAVSEKWAKGYVKNLDEFICQQKWLESPLPAGKKAGEEESIRFVPKPRPVSTEPDEPMDLSWLETPSPAVKQ